MGQAVASEIGGLFVKCDVSSEDDGAAAVAAASEMGPLRALVELGRDRARRAAPSTATTTRCRRRNSSS